MIRILTGDCRELLAGMDEASVDSCVTDPPYHLTSIVKRFGAANAAPAKVGVTGAYARASRGFMGQTWDGGDVAFDPATWAAVWRVLKPGAHLVAFSGSRTYHRMACAIEDAGFEIRDQLAWMYGSGFPKSHDVAKQIDKAAGAEREVIGTRRAGIARSARKGGEIVGCRAFEELKQAPVTVPATAGAAEWQGWGTALKPAWESICLAQKPYDFRQLCGILAQKIAEAVCQLPSLAKDAEPSSWLSLSVSAEGFGSAQWSAVAECNTPAALCGLMATWPSASALPSSLSTASSWLSTLAGLLAHESTFTIETVSSLTTDLRILNSLLSKNTPLIIAQAATPPSGEPSVAALAGSLFSAAEARLLYTRELSALDRAILKDLESSLGADVSPNWEPICLARKPLIGTVAANVLKYGTGALNIDGCRIEGGESTARTNRAEMGYHGGNVASEYRTGSDLGRWPANIIHDGSEEVLAGFPETASGYSDGTKAGVQKAVFGKYGAGTFAETYGDSGSAARFFYCAKATSAERGDGNGHPTVKPLALMQWLVRLVTPKGGTVLDPFAGSGSTLIAADAEQFDAIGCELSPEYAAIAERRIRDAAGLFGQVEAA